MKEGQSFLLQNLPVITFLMEAEPPHSFLFVNDGIEEITGYPARECLQENFFMEHVHEEDQEHLYHYLQDSQSQQECYVKFRFRFSDGTYHKTKIRINTITREDGEGNIISGVMYDVKGDDIAYEILKNREEIFRIASWCSRDLIFEKDIDSGKLTWFADIDEALNYEPGEFPRTIKAWQDSLHPNDVDRVINAIEQHVNDPSQYYEQEYLIRTKDGRYRIWIEHAQLITKDGKKTSRMIGSCSDITKSKQEFLQIQKMETVGRLAGGIAHDFNNLLTAIIGFSDMALQEENLNEECRVYINEIKNAGNLASSLTRQLLAFSRKQVFNIQIVNMNEVVKQTEKLVRRLIGENISIDLKLEPELFNTELDSSQIQQVIMNLTVNANDAMPDGGTVTIETYNAYLGEEYIQKYPEIHEGEYVALSIRDTGEGIPREDVARIFEPFFTTKGKGKGTGLGLSTVYGIVKQSKGYIYAYSKPGEGTEFRIYFPAVKSDRTKVEDSEKEGTGQKGKEIILLVEDEPLVRMLAESALSKKGYVIYVASCAEDALLLFDQHAEKINILVTDVIMPGMNGMQLAEKLLVKKPGLKILFMSGYPDDVITHYDDLGKGINLLQKPFSPDELTDMVRSVLDTNQGIA